MLPLVRYPALLLCSLFALLGSLGAQVTTTADDAIRPYDGRFRPGMNLIYIDNPEWNSFSLAELALGEPNKDIVGLGAKTLRPGLFDQVLVDGGNSYDRVIGQYKYFERLGADELTAIVGFPYYLNQEGQSFCDDPTSKNFGARSKLFKGLYLPIWDGGANGTPYNDDNTFAKYLYETVSVYTDYVRFWEIWNEPGFYDGPNPRVFWDGKNYKDGWYYNDPNPCDYTLRAPIQHYIRTLRIAYEIVHTVSPDDYVTVAGLGSRAFLDAILRNTDNPNEGEVTVDFPLKGGAYIDVLGFHTYPHLDGSTTYQPTGFYERHSDGAADGIINRKLKGYQETLAEYGYGPGLEHPAKLHLATEVNAPRKVFGKYSDGKPFFGGNQEQINFLPKSMVQFKINGVYAMYPYSLSDRVEERNASSEFDLMGFYKDLRRVTPREEQINDGGKSYKTAADFIYPTEYDSVATAALKAPGGVRAYAFAREDGSYLYVMWAETTEDLSEDASASFTFPDDVDLADLRLFRWDASYSNESEAVTRIVDLTATPVYITSGDAVISNNDPPTVTLSTPSSLVEGPFVVTATFSERVFGLIADDVAITNGTVSNFAGERSKYTFTVTPTAAGVVRISLPSGAAADTEGATSLTSNELQITYKVPDGGGEAASDLELLASSSAETVEQNTRVTYTFQLRNTGEGDAAGVSIAVQLPTGATFVSASPSAGSYVSTQGTWSVGAVGAGATPTLTIVAELTKVATATAYAQVSANQSEDPDSTPGNGTCCRGQEDDEAAVDVIVTPPVVEMADLSVLFRSGAVRVGANGSFDAELTIANDGPDAPNGVRVNLDLPTGVSVLNSTVPAGTQFNGSVWTVNRLASGATQTLKLGMRTSQSATGATIRAEVASSSLKDPDSTPGNGLSVEDDFAQLAFEGTTTARLTDLELTLVATDNEYRADGFVTCNVTVSNRGNADATGVIAQLSTHGALTFTRSKPSVGTYNYGSGRWTIPSVPAGRTVQLTITYFAVRALEPIVLFGQIMASSSPDEDSQAGNRLCCEAEEDDEAAFAITPIAEQPPKGSRPGGVSRPVEQVPTRGPLYLTEANPVQIQGVNYDGAYRTARVVVRSILPRTEGILVDALGRQVRTVIIGEGPGTYETPIDMSALPAGTYTLGINSPAGRRSVRILAAE